MTNTRPLPDYEDCYGPVPANEVTNDDLLKRYSCTKPTLFKRRDPLVENGWITLTKVGPRLYYGANAVHLIDQCSFWASKGYTIPEIVAHLTSVHKKSRSIDGGVNAFPRPMNVEAPDAAIDVKAKRVANEVVVRGFELSTTEKGLLGADVVEQIKESFRQGAKEGVKEALKEAMPQDHLAPHDFLSKAADKDYLLTGKLLAEGIRMRSSSVANWDNEVEKFGFLLSRVGKGQWRVKRLPS